MLCRIDFTVRRDGDRVNNGKFSQHLRRGVETKTQIFEKFLSHF